MDFDLNLKPPYDAGRPALCLHLVRSHGSAAQGALSIPKTGVGMSAVLALTAQVLDAAQRADADKCRITWDGTDWCVANDSHQLVCAVNSRVSKTAAPPVVLAAGDTLELGLHAFELRYETLLVTPQPLTKKERLITAAAPVVEPAEFDLRDLAMQPAAGFGAWSNNPFGVLALRGISAPPVVDALAELLGDTTRHPEQPFWVETSRVDALPPRATSGDRLLAELADEFVRVVRDPGALSGRVSDDPTDAFAGDYVPTLDDFIERAAVYPSTTDILKARGSIDALIDTFDAFGFDPVTFESEPKSVLHLFAPLAAQHAKAPMPPVTRRDHHSLSPDSHVNIGAYITPTSTSPSHLAVSVRVKAGPVFDQPHVNVVTKVAAVQVIAKPDSQPSSPKPVALVVNLATGRLSPPPPDPGVPQWLHAE